MFRVYLSKAFFFFFNVRPTLGSNSCFSQCCLRPTHTLLLRHGESIKLIYSCTSGCSSFICILLISWWKPVVSEKGRWAGFLYFHEVARCGEEGGLWAAIVSRTLTLGMLQWTAAPSSAAMVLRGGAWGLCGTWRWRRARDLPNDNETFDLQFLFTAFYRRAQRLCEHVTVFSTNWWIKNSHSDSSAGFIPEIFVTSSGFAAVGQLGTKNNSAVSARSVEPVARGYHSEQDELFILLPARYSSGDFECRDEAGAVLRNISLI